MARRHRQRGLCWKEETNLKCWLFYLINSIMEVKWGIKYLERESHWDSYHLPETHKRHNKNNWMLAPQSQSATRLYFSPVTSRRVMGPFWGTASTEGRAGFDFHLQLESFWKINSGIGNGKNSFPFLLSKHLVAASRELHLPNVWTDLNNYHP